MEKKYFVSDYNKKVNPTLNLPKSVTVFDTTLRDGEQLPGVSYKLDEKVEIARALDKLGVDIIEAGFPMNSKPEFDAVKRIANEKLDSEIAGLARVLKPDMDAALDADVDIVHVFVSTSNIHLKYQIQKTKDEVYDLAVNAVEYVKSHGRKCLFSPMDASRSDFDFLLRVCKGVEEAKVDVINIPDTVGVWHPSATKYVFANLKKKLKVPLDVHCHNDFGLAVANTLAAVEVGASQVQVSVNGMGERAGNASLEQVVMSLEALYNVKTTIQTQYLTEVSQLVEKYSEVTLQIHYPITGKTAFAHESGIHTHAVLRRGETFEPILPEMVGQKRRIVIGKHSGKASIQQALHDLGYSNVPQDIIVEITRKIKEMAESKKRIYDEDIVAIAEDILGHISKKKPTVSLEEVSVMTGNRITPTASIVLKYGNELMKGASQGVGPVDAAANAIQTAIGPNARIRLTEYNLRAITGGTDALADVTIKIEDEKKNTFMANAVNDDIVMASVEAIVRAINEAVAYKERTKTSGEQKK